MEILADGDEVHVIKGLIFQHHSGIPGEEMKLYFTVGFNTNDTLHHYRFFHIWKNDSFTCWYLLEAENDLDHVLFTNTEYGKQLGNELIEYLIGEKQC